MSGENVVYRMGNNDNDAKDNVMDCNQVSLRLVTVSKYFKKRQLLGDR